MQDGPLPRSMNHLLSLFFAAAILLSQNAFAQFQEIQSHVTEFTLKNGIKFIIMERHEAPVVSFHLYADVGSAQESFGITGLAHLFEHMAFKGSDTIGGKDIKDEKKALEKVDAAFAALQAEFAKGSKADEARIKSLHEALSAAQEEAEKYVVRNEFGQAIEQAGGRGLNATTAPDRTTYFYSLPSNALELWFYLESERFRAPVFREFYKECEVVMEERRMSVESNPIGKLLEEFAAVAYKAHPYREPTLGHMSDLKKLTRMDAETFFKKYYTTSNLTATVVGDVQPDRVRAMAEAYFGRLPAGAKPDPLRTVEPPQEGERQVLLRLQAQRLIIIGFHKPDINHPDNAVYDAISSVLSDGRSSRLYRSLIRDKRIAVDAGGFTGMPGVKYPGLFLFYAFPAPGHSNEETEKALDAEINRLISEPITSDELMGIKNRARANLIRSLDDNSGLADAFASYQALTGDWRNVFKQLDKINAVTPADIQRVAKATFAPTNRTVGLIEPLEGGPGSDRKEEK